MANYSFAAALICLAFCACMVNNNEAVRAQSQADRSDVTGGMMCVVAYLM